MRETKCAADKSTILREFSSLQDALTLVGQGASAENQCHTNAYLFKRPGRGKDRHAHSSAESWSLGIHRVAPMLELMTAGWREGRENLMKLSSDVGEVRGLLSAIRRPAWTEDGEDVNVDRLFNGDVDHAFRGTVKAMATGTRFVRLVCPVMALGDKDAEQFMWRGAATLVLADKLEEAGYRVSIDAYAWSYDVFEEDAMRLCDLIPVKRYEDAMDLDALAAVLGHPGFFRVIGFALRLTYPRTISDEMGRSMYERPDHLLSEGDVWVPNVFSRQAAQQFVAESITHFA
jgi:hypothetical protein